MDVQGGPWALSQEAHEQTKHKVFTCRGMKGVQAPQEPAVAHLSPHRLTPPPPPLPTPAQPPLPSESSRVSHQECDLLKPAWWRLQLQKKTIFLSGPCFLFAGWGFCLLVFGLSFLMQTISPVAAEQRCLFSNRVYTACHPGPPAPGRQGALSCVLALPAAPSPVTSRYPPPSCSGAESRAAGWAVGKQGHFCGRKWKNPLSPGWAGRRASLQVFQSFWNPLFLARSGWGRTRARDH